MLEAGKAKFVGEDFKFSWPKFLELRPFWVKNATRETCMCVYHLRWAEFANGLITYRKTLKAQNITACDCNATAPRNEKALRKSLICERREGEAVQSLDNTDCIHGRCFECQDLKKLTSGPGSLCADEMRDHGDGGLALKARHTTPHHPPLPLASLSLLPPPWRPALPLCHALPCASATPRRACAAGKI